MTTAYRVDTPGAAANALRRLREAAGITQDQVARQIANTRQIVNYRERGWRRLTAPAMFATADAIGCDVVIVPRRDRRRRPTGTGWPA